MTLLKPGTRPRSHYSLNSLSDLLRLFDSVPSSPHLKMSPTLRPPEEVRLKRTAMSTRELRRAEVLGRVKGAGVTVGRRSADAGVELSPDEETVAAISRGRSQ